MNLFEYSNIGQISDLVKDHFPQFYKEDGPVFIEFIQAYYEWLQDPDNPIGQARGRYQQFDIDTASKQFLEHYRRKYMWGLPPELLGNQRLLQKHILELYRSKGSQQAIRLLFRLLFNQDIEFYVPSYDIFKLSDNTWIEPHYIEITATPLIDRYHGKVITGSTSRATAIVENYQSRIVNGQQTYLLFISNIVGDFKPGEAVLTDGINPIESPMIKGSVVGYNILTSSPGVYVGDTLTAIFGEVPVELVVSETFEGSGSLDFSIVRPGTYYSLDATFVEQTAVYLDMLEPIVNLPISASAYGFPRDPDANVSSIIDDSIYIPGMDNIVPDYVPVSGGGAQIKIKTIKDTFVYEYNLDKVRDYLSVELDGVYPFPKLPTSNVATIVADSLGMNSVVVGSIESIQIINPGFNYSANSWFTPIDPYSSNSGIFDANGMNVGENGLVIGVPQLGTSIASEVKILTSGYNNVQYDPNNFLHDANNELMITGTPIVGGVGWAKGYYENTKSFASDDKYLFDGHYYQDFSYVIKAATTLDKYVDILKKLVHPAGNAVYGDIRIVKKNSLDHYAEVTRIKQTPKLGDGIALDFSNNIFSNIIDGIRDPAGNIANNVNYTRASPATYVDNIGEMLTSANNQLRLTYDPINVQPLGARLEGPSTNLLVQSVDLNQSPWVKSNNRVTISSPSNAPKLGPAYPLQYVRSAEAGTISGRSVYQVYTFNPGEIYSFTAYVAPKEVRHFSFWLPGCFSNSSNAGSVRFYGNMDAKTVVNNFGAAYSDLLSFGLTELPNGIFKLEIVARCIVDSPWSYTGNVSITLAGLGGNLSPDLAVGDGFYAGHFQVERLDYPSSYIPTTTDSITRVTDYLRFSRTITPRGTLRIKARTPDIDISPTHYLYQWDNGGSGSTRIFLWRSSNVMWLTVRRAGVNEFSINLGSAPRNTNVSIAVTWDEDNLSVSYNGGLATTMPWLGAPEIDNMIFGRTATNTNHWWGTISDYYVIDRTTDPTQLPLLTS